ncbi:gamma-glutamylcyclotransferase [Aestuariivita boseongensis]|uniref:gamma-glutamylcyclotransferase n=1 Tax=Aestuariivita boseongensis TaxID=1470562 RepID=UPI000682E5F8|nr:gamma-glutamylcyclotransferase [Aestuariivita boseongensis]
MPFPDHVFYHTPRLKGLITPPDISEVRFGLERFDELDQQAAEEGWPDGWRMDHDAREENRQQVLKDRMDRDLWVFGYGSLIWDPGVYVEEYRFGTLHGWRRSFCMLLTGGRGSHDRPGLMAALDEGDLCHGVVIRIAGQLVDRETWYMWNREMFAGSYVPLFLPVDTPQGPVEALAFVMNHENFRYCPDISREEAARMIAEAEGNLGPNFDYLDNLVRHLDELGIEDRPMRDLHALAAAHRAGPGTPRT